MQALSPTYSRPTSIIGESPRIRSVVERLSGLARARRTTLIVGETGTGKEIVARELHQASAGPVTPFVVVNCGALPENLVEAELFGHRRGAFTGAHGERRGLFRTAAGGTLFLDEIDSLSLAMQAKLLRFLETGEVRAVGDDRSQQVDAWVLAATNQDLTKLMDLGAFRADLFFRLDVLRVDLPPLRERGSDVHLLARYFLDRTSDRVLTFSRCALDSLARYPWPGNVRELRHRVERAALTTAGPVIDAAALGLDRPREHRGLASSELPTSDLASHLWSLVEHDGLSLSEAVRYCERMLIESALDEHDQNRTRAAHRLGIHVRTMFKKLSRD